MVVCETLLLDVVAPEAHQNDRSHVLSSVDLLSVDYARILCGGRLHGEHQKTIKLSKLGGGHLHRTVQ